MKFQIHRLDMFPRNF